ncbi:two-component system response regulator [Nitrospira sp.]|nr:two-component system response regulator [Nitrospira sp.]
MTDPSSTSRPLALVVDDDPTVQFLLQKTLQRAGLGVAAALSGSEAVEKCSRVKPDLVLLDIRMPGMDGFATCAALRHLPQAVHTPIVFMTGLDDTESMHAAYESGATNFIVKPLNPFLLSQRVRYLLRASAAIRELASSREHLASAQRLAHVGSLEWDVATGHLRLSDEACSIFGMALHSFRGTLQMLLPHVSPSVSHLIHAILADPGIVIEPYRRDHRITLEDGSDRIVQLQARAVLANDGRTTTTIVATVQDITERTQLEEHVHHLAYYDSLTGLPNRLLFRDRVQQAMVQSVRQQSAMAILFLDLDRFKFINDTFGHTMGDLLLKQVAERLIEVTRSSDSVGRPTADVPEQAVARLGGDEFTLLLTDLRQPEHASIVARRILSGLSRPFSLEGREVFVTASLGIAVYPTDGESLEELLKNADTAMYQAKSAGRDNYQCYSRNMNAMAAERLALENELRRAFDRQEFCLCYQPFVNIHSGQVVGAEALIRWMHPVRGLLAPGQFLSVIDDMGLSRRLGQWVTETACRQITVWQGLRPTPLRVAINVSNAQFRDPSLLSELAEILRSTGAAAESVELELTETIVMPHAEEAAQLLKSLKGMGLRLGLDDFGTGFSSISHLRTLPFDTIKIDRSFIVDVATNVQDAAIAEAMISMAHVRHMHVLAEGIESPEQLRLLKRLGCDEAQGYLFSKPVSADQFPALLGRSVSP